MREIQITTWAPTPPLRDSTSAAIEQALAAADRLPLADGSIAQLRYSRDVLDDVPQKTLLYRYDLFYWVEYGTFQTDTATLVDTGVVTITPSGAPTKPSPSPVERLSR